MNPTLILYSLSVWHITPYFLCVLDQYFSRCRKGSAELLVSFDDLYPTDSWSTDKQKDDKSSVKNFQICGKDVPRGYWV